DDVPRPLAPELELPHVGHVEEPDRAPHGDVLVDDALVLYRHLPARERDEARPRLLVQLVERGPAEGPCGVGHRRVERTKRRAASPEAFAAPRAEEGAPPAEEAVAKRRAPPAGQTVSGHGRQ